MRRVFLTVVCAVLGLVALVCFAVPLIILLADPPTPLIKDTKAFLGWGTPVEIAVKSALCEPSPNRHFRCTLVLDTPDSRRIIRTVTKDVQRLAPSIRQMSTAPGDFAVHWGTADIAARWGDRLIGPALVAWTIGGVCLLLIRFLRRG